MYMRPLALTASKSRSASSSDPKTAGTAEATCLPALSDAMASRAWLGASVATKMASSESSLISASHDGYIVSQPHLVASSAHLSGSRSATAATVTFGWS